MEMEKEEVETASQLYLFIDQAYSWALSGMKFVASLSMRDTMSTEELQEQIKNYDDYMSNHPPIPNEEFTKMQQKTLQYNNVKCQRQCEVAQRKCTETKELFVKRRKLLVKARDRQLQEIQKREEKISPQLQKGGEITHELRKNNNNNNINDTNCVKNENPSRAILRHKSDVSHRLTNGSSITAINGGVPALNGGLIESAPAPTLLTSSKIKENNNTNDTNSKKNEKPSCALLRHQSDVSHRLTNGSNITAINGGVPALNGPPIESDAAPTSLSSTKLIENNNNNNINDSHSVKNEKPTGALLRHKSDVSHRLKNGSSINPINGGLLVLNGGPIESAPAPTSLSHSLKNEKSSFALLRHKSDVSHRLTNGSSITAINGGVPVLNRGPIESAAPTFSSSSKHRPKKLLKKSASMSGQHTRLRIGLPMRCEEPSTEGRTRWSLAIEELITTEEEYVKSLNYIIEHYYPLMNQLDHVPQSLRGKRGVVFGNVENICDFHAGNFLEALRECHDRPRRVAEVFIQHRESFGMYALYSKNKPRSDELMREHGTKFFKAKQHSLRDKMDLSSYLLKPVQRMGKYALLLHNIAKHSEIQYRSLLKEAEALVKFQLRHGNDLLAMDSIVDCDVNLKEQGELRRQDEFLIFRGRRKYIRHVFLFDELVLLSKPQRVHGGHDVYHYKSSHKTSEIGLTENIGDTGLKFEIWFRRLMHDNIIFNSVNQQKKQTWVDDIRSILWNQALRNKANRRNEMANMGVGSKPHLDIRTSESPITDRSVATERLMGGRILASRSRASIAVATFEHAYKRPHSTVSTSSTSSNGSFQLAHHRSSMFDFRAIVEGEEYESGSGHGSSISISNGGSDPPECVEAPQVAADRLPQQYVTTV